MKHFLPFNTYSSPSLTAVVLPALASEPAPGSVKQNAPKPPSRTRSQTCCSCDQNRLHSKAARRDRGRKSGICDRHLLDECCYIHTGKSRSAVLFRNLESLISLLDRFLINCLRPFAGNIVFFALFNNFFVTEIFYILQEILRFFRN